ncbi:chromate efflux transporter [Sporomusa malonica]|uniref:Chromate transporter n=1 Tax=Sporomusa malonica TaxID=112901 RepID=A0A1W1Y7D9_9FIRM|nr:chromate efflux transporter [Sporomusa malonica]SMC32067.1 chromate transporter [Sporomusa malonica]
MGTANQRSTLKSDSEVIPLWRLFLIYIVIGSTGFGPTLAAETKKRLVQKEQWIKEEDFVNGLSLAQLLPGAIFVNLTVYVGYKLRGISGALTAFLAFLLVPFATVLILSHVYFTYQTIEVVSILFKGVAVVIVGVIAHAVIEVGRSTVVDMAAGIIALVSAGLMLFSGSPFTVLLIAALAGILAYYRSLQRQTEVLLEARSTAPKNDCFLAVRVWRFIALGTIAAIALYAAPVQPILMQLGWVFFRMGAVLFGGGLSMIPFIQQEVVSHYGWMTLEEFAVGIALSQMTPGPVLIIATFVGYKVAAISGAIAATMGIFLPSLFLVMGTAQIHQKIRNTTWVQAALKGIAASFTGMMAVLVVGLARHSLTDIPSFIVAMMAFLAMRFGKLDIIVTIVSGTIVYWLLALMGIVM